MRDSYRLEHFTFDHPNLPQYQWPAFPNRIVLHRQGNPGAHARDALEWGNREGAFSIHSYIEDDVCIDAVPGTSQAWHVTEARRAAELGFDTGPYARPRGDFLAYGIETVDLPGGGPGQRYHLSQETRITLLLVVRDVCRTYGIPPSRVYEHADMDPWTRADDLGDALFLPDFRLDLADLMAGRTPWRTVKQHAFGYAALAAWQTEDAIPPRPDPHVDLPIEQPARVPDFAEVRRRIEEAQVALELAAMAARGE